MSENPPQQPPEDDPQRPPQQPPQQPPPPPYGQQPYGAHPGPPPDPNLRNPNLYPGVEYPPDRTAGPVSPTAGTFFGALVDFSFTRYVTPTIVKIVYIIGLVLLALQWVVIYLAAIVALFDGDTFLPGLLTILFGWIIALVQLALFRMVLEFFQAMVSISEKVNLYARRDDVA